MLVDFLSGFLRSTYDLARIGLERKHEMNDLLKVGKAATAHGMYITVDPAWFERFKKSGVVGHYSDFAFRFGSEVYEISSGELLELLKKAGQQHVQRNAFQLGVWVGMAVMFIVAMLAISSVR